MRLVPIISWWLLIPLCLLCLGLGGLYGWRFYKGKRSLSKPWLRRGLLLVLLVLASLNPSVPRTINASSLSDRNVVFLVDTTASMNATDYKGNAVRLDGVKSDMLAIEGRLPGASMTIIAFDSKPNAILSDSTDSVAFKAAVQSLHPEIYGTSKGSAIDVALEPATELMKALKAAAPNQSRILFYMGDGENTTPTKAQSFKGLAPYVTGGAVLGYGTTTGAHMIKYTGVTTSSSTANQSYIMTIDPASKKIVPAISKLHPETLQAIASQTGTTYIDRDAGGSIASLVPSSKTNTVVAHTRTVTHYFGLYWLFMIPIVGLLFWEWRKIVLLEFEVETVVLKRGHHE